MASIGPAPPIWTFSFLKGFAQHQPLRPFTKSATTTGDASSPWSIRKARR